MADKKKKSESVMIVSIKTLLESDKSLKELGAIKLPIKTAYWIGRIANKVKSEIAQYSETRDTLVKSLGTEKDGEWTVKDENLTEFFSEVGKLQDIEVDLGFDKIKLDDFGSIDIEPQLLLVWLVE